MAKISVILLTFLVHFTFYLFVFLQSFYLPRFLLLCLVLKLSSDMRRSWSKLAYSQLMDRFVPTVWFLSFHNLSDCCGLVVSILDCQLRGWDCISSKADWNKYQDFCFISTSWPTQPWWIHSPFSVNVMMEWRGRRLATFPHIPGWHDLNQMI